MYHPGGGGGAGVVWGVRGRGHAWQGVCVAEGACIVGVGDACVPGGGIRARGACMASGVCMSGGA